MTGDRDTADGPKRDAESPPDGRALKRKKTVTWAEDDELELPLGPQDGAPSSYAAASDEPVVVLPADSLFDSLSLDLLEQQVDVPEPSAEEPLTRRQLLQRRLARTEQLAALYETELWALLEELRLRHQQFTAQPERSVWKQQQKQQQGEDVEMAEAAGAAAEPQQKPAVKQSKKQPQQQQQQQPQAAKVEAEEPAEAGPEAAADPGTGLRALWEEQQRRLEEERRAQQPQQEAAAQDVKQPQEGAGQQQQPQQKAGKKGDKAAAAADGKKQQKVSTAASKAAGKPPKEGKGDEPKNQQQQKEEGKPGKKQQKGGDKKAPAAAAGKQAADKGGKPAAVLPKEAAVAAKEEPKAAGQGGALAAAAQQQPAAQGKMAPQPPAELPAEPLLPQLRFEDVEALVLSEAAASLAPVDEGALVAQRARFVQRLELLGRLEQGALAATCRELDAVGGLAVLCGHRARYVLRRPCVAIGRSSGSQGKVDLDLSVEAPSEGIAQRVSRQQAQLWLEPDGSFRLRCTGRRPMRVNGALLAQGAIAPLPTLSHVAVGGVSLLFVANVAAAARAAARTVLPAA